MIYIKIENVSVCLFVKKKNEFKFCKYLMLGKVCMLE